MTICKQYLQVKEFHKAFGHPWSDSAAKVSNKRAHIRSMWMQEEVNEFIQASFESDYVEEADAMIDLAYFALGTLVELGANPSYNKMGKTGISQRKIFGATEAFKISQRFMGIIQRFMMANFNDDWEGQKDAMLSLLNEAVETLNSMGLDPKPLFDIVHQANMSKLFPDGKPRFDKFGKTIKPEGWINPHDQLVRVINGDEKENVAV